MAELASYPPYRSIPCTYKVVAYEELNEHIEKIMNERDLNEISFTGSIPHPCSEHNIQAWRNSIRRIMQHEIFNIDILKIWMRWQDENGVQKGDFIYDYNTDMSVDELKIMLDSTNASSACFEIMVEYFDNPQLEDSGVRDDASWLTVNRGGGVDLGPNFDTERATAWQSRRSTEDADNKEELSLDSYSPKIKDRNEPQCPSPSLSAHGSPASTTEQSRTISREHPLTRQYLDLLAQPPEVRDESKLQTIIEEIFDKLVFKPIRARDAAAVLMERYGVIPQGANLSIEYAKGDDDEHDDEAVDTNEDGDENNGEEDTDADVGEENEDDDLGVIRRLKNRFNIINVFRRMFGYGNRFL